MQELGKLDFKMNVIPNESEKYKNFSFADNKLFFIDSSQSFKFFVR